MNIREHEKRILKVADLSFPHVLHETSANAARETRPLGSVKNELYKMQMPMSIIYYKTFVSYQSS